MEGVTDNLNKCIMTMNLANGNHIKVHKVIDVGFNRTYIDFTVYQKDGYWKHNENAVFMGSIYSNVNDYLGSLYQII